MRDAVQHSVANTDREVASGTAAEGRGKSKGVSFSRGEVSDQRVREASWKRGGVGSAKRANRAHRGLLVQYMLSCCVMLWYSTFCYTVSYHSISDQIRSVHIITQCIACHRVVIWIFRKEAGGKRVLVPHGAEAGRDARRGTNGVSTHGVMQISCFLTEGLLG